VLKRVTFYFFIVPPPPDKCSLRFQDGLRRRMDKLKSSIEEGNRAVDKEREKNVSLLHLIFPPDIAKRLWLGKSKVEQLTPSKSGSFRGDDRVEDPRGRDHAVQRHRRLHVDLLDGDAHDGDQHAPGPVQSVRRVLRPARRLQSESSGANGKQTDRASAGIPAGKRLMNIFLLVTYLPKCLSSE
jgi:hypothetical protein